MDYPTAVGAAIIVLAILAVIGLYVWSVRRIETIHRKKLTNLRQIMKEFGNDRSDDA